jgi:hypothetical protein
MTSTSDQQPYIKCPFCESGHILLKAGSTGCPKCYVKVWLDDRMEYIFVDKSTFRLPIHGTICGSCGLVQRERNDKCWYCGMGLSPTMQ